MEKESELINDTEKLLQTFEYVLILENKCIELNNKLKHYNKVKKQLNSYGPNNLKKEDIVASKIDEINLLKSELASVSDDNSEKDLVIASKVDEINLLTSELDDCKSMCGELTSDLSDYEKIKFELNECKHDNFEMDVVIASKIDEINLLKDELKSYKNRCHELNDIIAQKDDSINNLTKNVADLEKEIDYLKNQS